MSSASATQTLAWAAATISGRASESRKRRGEVDREAEVGRFERRGLQRQAGCEGGSEPVDRLRPSPRRWSDGGHRQGRRQTGSPTSATGLCGRSRGRRRRRPWTAVAASQPAEASSRGAPWLDQQERPCQARPADIHALWIVPSILPSATSELSPRDDALDSRETAESGFDRLESKDA